MRGRLLVLAPHPDDEILGAGGIMARHAQRGGEVAVIVASDGGRSDPAVPASLQAARRRSECCNGLMALLGVAPPLLFLSAPDGGLEAAMVPLGPDSALGQFLAQYPPTTIITTDPADAHPDHKAAFGLASRIIAAGHGAVLQVMPVSQRIDGVFDPRGYEAWPVAEHAPAKATALACHVSQIDTATGFALSTAMLAGAAESEYLRLAFDRRAVAEHAVPADHFDQLFAASRDPWDYDHAAYERDRFARTVRALADRRYRSALELGCANGALTSHLAPLCDRLVATDVSAMAVLLAEARLEDARHVRIEHGAVPADLSAQTFDLFVLSDMLYYLGLDGIVQLLALLEPRAAPQCRWLIASYLGETETRLTGEMASEAAIGLLDGWQPIHAERTDRLRIDVLERRR